jgi:hypothetical protein
MAHAPNTPKAIPTPAQIAASQGGIGGNKERFPFIRELIVAAGALRLRMRRIFS